MNDLVSIIMPSYNAENYIFAAIESVRKQTYSNWELIIVDDCSKDNTLEVVKPFMETDERIKYECNPSLIFTKLLQKNWNGTLAKFKK